MPANIEHWANLEADGFGRESIAARRIARIGPHTLPLRQRDGLPDKPWSLTPADRGHVFHTKDVHRVLIVFGHMDTKHERFGSMTSWKNSAGAV